MADELEPGNYSSRAYLDHVGSKLRAPGSIVRQCHKLGVPMFCPAINDSIVMAYIFNQERGHDYAIQVTTAVTQDGGLSSTTLGEAQSWGKVDAKAKFAMAWVEPSVSLPLLAGYVFNPFPAPARKRLKWTWDDDGPVSLMTR